MRPSSPRVGFLTCAFASALPIIATPLPVAIAGPQDPARRDGGVGFDPAAVGTPRQAPPQPQPPAPVTTRREALTRIPPERYERAYPDARILDRLRAPGSAADSFLPPASPPAIDPRAMRQASDDFARTLGPALQRLRRDVEAQLRNGQH